MYAFMGRDQFQRNGKNIYPTVMDTNEMLENEQLKNQWKLIYCCRKGYCGWL